MNLADEIRKQIEKNKGLKLAVGEINNHLSILEELVRKDIMEQVDEAYQKGLVNGKWKSEDGCTGCKYEGKTGEHLPCEYCKNNFRSQWTAKADKIEVGDVVEWTGDKYIVTYINYDIDTSEITDYDLLGEDGSVADHVKKCAFTKTGRHVDIASILEDMKHD